MKIILLESLIKQPASFEDLADLVYRSYDEALGLKNQLSAYCQGQENATDTELTALRDLKTAVEIQACLLDSRLPSYHSDFASLYQLIQAKHAKAGEDYKKENDKIEAERRIVRLNELIAESEKQIVGYQKEIAEQKQTLSKLGGSNG